MIRLIRKQSVTGCCRNSATSYTLDVADILHTLDVAVCNYSHTACRINSATIHTLDVAEILSEVVATMPMRLLISASKEKLSLIVEPW